MQNPIARINEQEEEMMDEIAQLIDEQEERQGNKYENTIAYSEKTVSIKKIDSIEDEDVDKVLDGINQVNVED